MANHSDVRFSADYMKKNVLKKDYKGFDLCVLASSDHTVITYGTFGRWGALLSGGDVIAPKGPGSSSVREGFSIFSSVKVWTEYIRRRVFLWRKSNIFKI